MTGAAATVGEATADRVTTEALPKAHAVGQIPVDLL